MYPIVALCVWENTDVLPATRKRAEVWHFAAVHGISSPALWEGPETRTSATSFSCPPNYYSVLFLVKSGKPLATVFRGTRIRPFVTDVLQLNNTSIYLGHFVFRLSHIMANLNVLQHRQNTFRLSIKSSDISALVHNCYSSCSEYVYCILSHNLAYKNFLCPCVVCCVGCGLLFSLLISQVSFPSCTGLFDMHSTAVPLTGMVVIQRETWCCHLPSFWEGFAKIAFHEKNHGIFLRVFEFK